jgi:hypothetical protein
MKIQNIKTVCLATAVAFSVLFTACSPDEVTTGNPITQADIDASFTATTQDGNRYQIVGSDDANIQYHLWEWTTPDGTPNPQGSGERKGESAMEFVFATPGTYTVRHRVVGFTGGTNSVSEQSFVVTTFALEDNVVASPNFEDPADWTVLNISNNNAVVWTFNTGSATVSGGDTAYSGKGIYQVIEAEAGQYLLDMHVEGPGSADTWFEVFVSPVAPVQGSDYNAGGAGANIALNTWAGCGNAPFNGQLATISCAGSGAVLEIEETGPVYLVIKSGSGQNNGINSITVSNVSLRKFIE